MDRHYIFVDLENVVLDCSLLPVKEELRVMIFVGAKQKNVPVKTAIALQSLGPLVEYITVSEVGPNALDFLIAYYIGKITQADPLAVVRVVSNDKGFDPLIRHLRSTGCDATRLETVVPKKKKMATGSAKPEPPVKAALSYLHRVKKNRPRKIKSLKNALKSSVDQKMSDSVLEALVNQLSEMGYINVTDMNVNYNLPKARQVAT